MKGSKKNPSIDFYKLIKKLLNKEAAPDILGAAFDAFKYYAEPNFNNEFLKIFNSYDLSGDEFTKSPDTLTPEVLGIIYETIHSQRKTNGVFYTPQQIVLFMCRECLKNFISNSVEGITNIFDYIEIGKVSYNQALSIDLALANAKVCDPAVGCGAFAVGMLHEISSLREQLSYLIDSDRTLYELKKHTVENCIYGADIDEGAIEITKRRLWLSLFNENNSSESIDNIRFNIVPGNSLTGEVDFLYTRDYFDIVLANPPYVGEKGNKELFHVVKSGPLGEFYQGKMDLFYFFFHLALNTVKLSGEIAFITTNYFATASGAQKLRKDLKERACFTRIINFNGLKIFNSALGQNNMISFMRKSQDKEYLIQISSIQEKGCIESENLDSILNSNIDCFNLHQDELYDGEEDYIRLYGSGSNNLIENIVKKIKYKGIPLGQVCHIHQGLKTNADKVTQKHLENYPELCENNIHIGEGIFILYKEDNLLSRLSESEMRFIKPLFKNSDIKHYFTSANPEEYVIFITKEDYLTEDDAKIKEHLDKYNAVIKNRAEVDPAGGIPLYAITRPRKKYMYYGPKIVAPYKSKSNTFGYNECEWYASGDVYYINQKSSNLDLKYILALLNSKLYSVWFNFNGKRKGGLVELYQKPLSEVPIMKLDDAAQKNLVSLVDSLLVNGLPDNEIIKKIDNEIYRLFNLNKDEIALIESIC